MTAIPLGLLGLLSAPRVDAVSAGDGTARIDYAPAAVDSAGTVL